MFSFINLSVLDVLHNLTCVFYTSATIRITAKPEKLENLPRREIMSWVNTNVLRAYYVTSTKYQVKSSDIFIIWLCACRLFYMKYKNFLSENQWNNNLSTIWLSKSHLMGKIPAILSLFYLVIVILQLVMFPTTYSNQNTLSFYFPLTK